MIAGLSHKSSVQAVTNFSVSAVKSPSKKIKVTAVIIPRVTCDLPCRPIEFDCEWKHLSDLDLADPGCGQPGRIDILMGVDIFVQVLLQGRRIGPPGSPVALETELGWVLAGRISSRHLDEHIATHHVSLDTGDDILQRFWELEEDPLREPFLTSEERIVVQHFQTNHSRSSDGGFIVPLPRKPDARPLGESRSQAVKRFFSLERSMHSLTWSMQNPFLHVISTNPQVRLRYSISLSMRSARSQVHPQR